MKQKHWKVSVFDKTSEIIRDDTFYTTDTEAYLIFELTDEGFTPDAVMVTVYNVYGKATINASAEVVDGIVRYEMPEDAIGHPGGWRTQVIFTKDNEDYTTKIIEFDVGGHLLDNKKPAIVDIENWNSFIAHAGELVDDWEQLEKIRQANERKRESAESVRQANEQGRETAESVRVANEVERISKDGERDSKIDEIEGIVEDVSGKLDNKANKKQADWITPTLLNGVEDTPDQPIRFMKDEFGFVHMGGRLTNAVLRDSIFVLPQGYRPGFAVSVVGTGGGGSHVLVSISPTMGNVFALSGNLTYITLDGISFYAGGD